MEKQKEFNSKAQKIRRFKADIKEAGLIGVQNQKEPSRVVRIGRLSRKSPKENLSKLSIHETINNKGLSIDRRKTIVRTSKIDRKLKNLFKQPKVSTLMREIPSIKLK